MSIVNFKFKCSTDVDVIKFDELFISIRDVIEIIKQRKKISEKNDLQLINETTNETYTDEKVLISNGTNLLVTRIPSKSQNRRKDKQNFNCDNSSLVAKVDINAPLLAHVGDLSTYETSEEDKIDALIYQSTVMYSPINYIKSDFLNQVGPVPPSYRCRKCHKKGHWIKDCLSSSKPYDKQRRTTGIPRSQLVTVEDSQVKGALMTETGSFAVTLLDHQTFTDQNKKRTNNKTTKTLKEEPSTNEVAADKFEVFEKIEFNPLSEKSVELGVVKSNLLDISILKKSTLPLPLPTLNYPKVLRIPDGLPFIDFSKPPPQIPSNFLSVNQQRSSPTNIDEINVFLNNLCMKDEEDREKQKRQSYKYRTCSRSRSSSIPPTSSSSRYRMKSPNNSNNHSKELKSRVCDSVTQHKRSDLTKLNTSHSHHSFREPQYRERKETIQDEDRRGEQRNKFSPRRRHFYEKVKYRK